MEENNSPNLDNPPSRASLEPRREPITIKRSLVYAGIFSVVILVAFTLIMVGLIKENSQCVSNAFVYGANQIETARGDPQTLCSCETVETTFCACSLINNGKFWFDDEEVYLENPRAFNSIIN